MDNPPTLTSAGTAPMSRRPSFAALRISHGIATTIGQIETAKPELHYYWKSPYYWS